MRLADTLPDILQCRSVTHKLFVESRSFTKWATEHLNDGDVAHLQQQLVENPNAGAVIPGGGGLRKLRFADPARQKGKRGGARLVYLHVPEADWIFLLDAYDKNDKDEKDEKDDLSPEERRQLRILVQQLRATALNSKREG